MRVTRETRERTRSSLLDAGRRRFDQIGFEATTTREIAEGAGIAAGTLFNYFPTKEALGVAILEEAIARAEVEFEGRERGPLEPRLFAHVAIQLRHLAPHRAWIGELLDSGSSPLRDRGDGSTDGLRARHLERVEGWLREEGFAEEGPLTLHLYWTLFLGVLDFWSRDPSHNQEATLALLDRSMGLFYRGLQENR